MTVKRKDVVHRMHHILTRRRESLRRSLLAELNLLGMSHDLRPVGDEGDDAQDSFDDEMNLRLAQVESGELRAIELALDKIRCGEYGICDNCSRNIPLARLRALPYARRCIECERCVEVRGRSAVSDERLELPAG